MKFAITKTFGLAALLSVLFLFSCTKENNFDLQNEDLTQDNTEVSTQELSDVENFSATDAASCSYPGIEGATCSAGGDGGLYAMPIDLVAYGQCNEDLYEDFKPITFDGVVYEYDGPADDATLAFSGIVFDFITSHPVLVSPDVKETEARLMMGGFWACLAEIIGVTDMKKLLKAWQRGRLTKKAVWKIVKRNLKRKLGPIGAAISLCEFIECLAT